MFDKKLLLLLMLFVLTLSIVGCKGVLDEEKYLDKSLGVYIKVEPKVNINGEEHILSETHLNQLKKEIIEKIDNCVDMEVSSINGTSQYTEVDYVLNVDVSNITYENKVETENKEVKETLHDMTVTLMTIPKYKTKSLCKLDITYQLLKSDNNNVIINEQEHVSNNKTEETEFTKISDTEKYVVKYVMEKRLEYIQETIMKPLREIVGY